MHRNQLRSIYNNMEDNSALMLYRILRRYSQGRALPDAQLRKLTGLSQGEIDMAAEQLEAEGMIVIERTYAIAEE